MYNLLAMTQDYHLVKRKRKSGSVYMIALLDSKRGSNGRPRYKEMVSSGTGNRNAADRIARQLLAEGKIGASRDDIAAYLIEFWDPDKSDYLQNKAATGDAVSTQYCNDNRQKIRAYVLPFLKERNVTQLRQLTRRHCEQWVTWVRQNHGHLSVRTVNGIKACLNTALNRAVAWELIPGNPMKYVDNVKGEAKERKPFTLDELRALFADPWPDVRPWCACLLAAKTGARLGEIRALKLKHIHVQDRYLDVMHSWSFYDGLKRPKNRDTREGVYLDDACVLAIAEVLKIHPWKDDPESFLIFSSQIKRQPLERNTIVRALQKRMDECKITDRTFHSFRHAWISHVAERLPADKVAKLVGQKTPGVTMRYIHTTNNDRAIGEQVSRSLFQIPQLHPQPTPQEDTPGQSP